MKDLLYRYGIVPVVTIEDENDASATAEALCNGHLGCAEITFRSASAENDIRLIKKARPDMFLIAGTVLSAAQADEAIDAGAKLIVSPGFNIEVAEHCRKKGYPYMPGVCTPTEIEMALSHGYDTLKFYPAELSGGIKMLETLHGPYHDVMFMPTGGINIDNASDYLKKDYILCVGGTWIADRKLIEEGRFDLISENAARAHELVKTLR